jgi:biotin carboxylase
MNRKKHLAFVESNTSGTGDLFVQAAEAEGFRPVLLTANPRRYPYLRGSAADVFVVDPRDETALIAACRSLKAIGGLAGVTSSAEDSLDCAAAVARGFGLPGPDPDAVRNCRGRYVHRVRLAEEGARGPAFSVETFGMHVVGITRKHLGPRPHFVAMGHDFPAALEPDVEEALCQVALGALKALGLGWGPAHTEIRLTVEGPEIIKVNPRLADGLIPRLVKLATGIDLIRDSMRLVSAREPRLARTSTRFASLRFVVPPQEGALVAVEGLEAASRLLGVVELHLTRPRPGPVGRHGDFRDRIGHVIAAADTPTAARSIADRALALIRLTFTPG